MISKLSKNSLSILEFISEKKLRLYRIEDMELLLNELRDNDWIGVRTTIEDLLEAMKPYEVFSTELFEKRDLSQIITRYTAGKINDLLLINSLAPNSFFSHQTALSFHEIAVNHPKNIYQTLIQYSNDPPSQTVMQQTTIDRVFGQPQRLPSLPFCWKDYHIYQSQFQ